MAAVTTSFDIAEWLKDVDRSKQKLFRTILNEVDVTFNDIIMFRTPEDDVTKKGAAKATDDHIKMNWAHWVDESNLEVGFSNPLPYGTVLDEGKYPSVGKGSNPRTIDTGKGIFSKMAPKGIIKPLLEDNNKALREAVELIEKKLNERVHLILEG